MGARMGRPRKFAEAEVVRDAMRVFWDQGFGPTSVADLSGATGLLPGSLYGAFGDKRGLFAKALGRYVQDQDERVRTLLEGGGSPLQGLRDYLAWQVELACGTGCMVAKTAVELAPGDRHVAAMVHQTMTGLRARLAEALSQAQRAGEISARWEPAAAAGVLLAHVEGLHVLGRTEDPATLRADSAALLEALR